MRGVAAIAGIGESDSWDVTGSGLTALDLIGQATPRRSTTRACARRRRRPLHRVRVLRDAGAERRRVPRDPPALQRLDEPRRARLRQPPPARRRRDRGRALRRGAHRLRLDAASRRRAAEERRRVVPPRRRTGRATRSASSRWRPRATCTSSARRASSSPRSRSRRGLGASRTTGRSRATRSRSTTSFRADDLDAADEPRRVPGDRRRRRAARHERRARRDAAPAAGAAARRGRGPWHRNISPDAGPRPHRGHGVGRARVRARGRRPADVDAVEVYDAFTICTILFLEDLGFCAKGEGGAFVAGGRIAPGGELPVNTNGGGLSYCHPGMYGIFVLVEAARRIRAGDDVVLAHGNGAVLCGAVDSGSRERRDVLDSRMGGGRSSCSPWSGSSLIVVVGASSRAIFYPGHRCRRARLEADAVGRGRGRERGRGDREMLAATNERRRAGSSDEAGSRRVTPTSASCEAARAHTLDQQSGLDEHKRGVAARACASAADEPRALERGADAMARLSLIVGCELPWRRRSRRDLRAAGHRVRGTTRDPARASRLAEAARPGLGDPDASARSARARARDAAAWLLGGERRRGPDRCTGRGWR